MSTDHLVSLMFTTSGGPTSLFLSLVALLAGLIRGFTGFGGPAFMLAILTIFFPPISILSKILIMDFFANVYLFKSRWKQVDWRVTGKMVIPTLLLAPVGHWLLTELDPSFTKRIIGIIIALTSLSMLAGIRYKAPMTTGVLILVGSVAGLVFGGTYIALIAVVAVLLGPYDKERGRTMIIAWSFFAVLVFAMNSVIAGTANTQDIVVAIPGAISYMLGTWLGSLGFRQSSEQLFRRTAILLLLFLAVCNLLI